MSLQVSRITITPHVLRRPAQLHVFVCSYADGCFAIRAGVKAMALSEAEVQNVLFDQLHHVRAVVRAVWFELCGQSSELP